MIAAIYYKFWNHVFVNCSNYCNYSSIVCLHLIARMDGDIIFNDVFAMSEMLNEKSIPK